MERMRRRGVCTGGQGVGLLDAVHLFVPQEVLGDFVHVELPRTSVHAKREQSDAKKRTQGQRHGDRRGYARTQIDIGTYAEKYRDRSEIERERDRYREQGEVFGLGGAEEVESAAQHDRRRRQLALPLVL
jgi:hypothetical protein